MLLFTKLSHTLDATSRGIPQPDIHLMTWSIRQPITGSGEDRDVADGKAEQNGHRAHPGRHQLHLRLMICAMSAVPYLSSDIAEAVDHCKRPKERHMLNLFEQTMQNERVTWTVDDARWMRE